MSNTLYNIYLKVRVSMSGKIINSNKSDEHTMMNLK